MHRLRLIIFNTLLACALPLAAHADDFPQIYDSPGERDQRPMAPAAAAAAMQVPNGFRVSVFAAEPQVQNPIAMAWDERGRMWVAENFTYADRTQRFDLSLRDRVLILEDTDHDGQADRRAVFTDNVQMLTSVEVGRGGVWLMCPPRVLFIPNADGDDVPDGPAQVVLDGFTVAKDNYHNFANGLRWGPDGWLYGRCGHSCPGRLGVPGTPDEQRVPIDGGIWRFHPERKVVEVLCHGTTNPWGHDWDEHGELLFVNTVIGHLWHMLPGAHFKESFGESMNPAVYERLDTVADHYHFDTRGNWTESRDGKANELGGGHSHVGAMIYQGRHWPRQYRNRLMTLNQHGRRANVERLERQGAGYVARHEPDFCLAADPFFRGVEISEGPDGNVYVLDWSDTGECHEHSGVHRTSGRIFKISYGSPGAVRPVVKPWCMAGNGKLPRLWRQYQSGETTPEQLRSLLADDDEHVRVWAIRLLTDFWPLDTIVGPRRGVVYADDPASRAAFVRMAQGDPSGLVLLALASTLQRLPVNQRAELAQALVAREEFAGDRTLPSLVWFGLIPLGDYDARQLVTLARACRWPTTLRWIARNLTSRMEGQPEPLDELLTAALSMPLENQVAVLHGMHEAVQGWRRAPQPASWNALAGAPAGRQEAEIVRELSTLFGDGRALDEIRRIALDDGAELSMRQQALETLIDARPDDLRAVCERLLDVRTLNATAARGLSMFDDPAIAQRLVSSYRRFHQQDRPAVIELLVSRAAFAAALLASVGEGGGKIPPAEITASHARQILSLNDDNLSRKLAEVWGELRDTPADRMELMASLRRQLAPDVLHSADLTAGRALYEKTCAQCHVLYGAGKKVGPDLTGSQRGELDYLLQNMVDPSAVVGKDYRMTIIITADGRTLNGLIVSQDDKIMVLQTQTEQLAIALEDVEQTQATTLSPMPDGLLANLSPEQIRDLFAYLMHPSQVPLESVSRKR